jgi:aryl-alcohol dehydrogenase-like predicted oxidoreductase/PIN domain nuclease of toxin-antitoxin system
VRLLLDTHVLLWWFNEPEVLTEQALEAIADETNVVYVSSATVWEAGIKQALGKLRGADDLVARVREQRLDELPIEFAHAAAAAALPGARATARRPAAHAGLGCEGAEEDRMTDVVLGQGLRVSPLGLGCMGMSEFYGATDWDSSLATIHRALDLGVTFLDTANVYGEGHNEVLVGRAIVGRRDEVQLATKFGIDRTAGDRNRTVRGDHDYVKRACEASLLRLGVDVIDLYYLHRPPANAEIEETVGAMAELVAEGKVRHLGLSEVDEGLLRRACAVHPIAALQSEYSLWTRDPEQLAPALAELGVGLVPYSPLGRGFLTGTVDPKALGPKDFRQHSPRFKAADDNAAIAEAVRQQASRLGAEPAQVAIAWVLAQAARLGVPVVPIPGTKRVRWLEQNVGALDVTLDDEALAALDPLGDQVVGARY